VAKILHKHLAFAVNGCVFDVHNDVGPGVREESYQKGMEIRLTDRGLPFIAKPHTRRELIHRGEVADIFEPDFVVADRVILELKAQREGLNRINFMQTLNYVKLWEFSLGLLTNFAEARAVIKRVPYLPRQVAPMEDYEFIQPLLTPSLREELRVVRDSLLTIHRGFGIGYWDTTYRNLIAIEFQHCGLTCRRNLQVTPTLDGRELPTSPISPLLVGSEILVEVEALHDEVTARAIRTMQSHLKLTGARLGLVVHFGKDRFEIRGFQPLKK
jgi:GxxExxY protein